jgi:hypothetical protein
MKKIYNAKSMEIRHLINSIYFQLRNGEFKKGLISEYWVELNIRLKKISWDERLIEIYNSKFYNEYIKTGVLTKKFEHKNGLPINWEMEYYDNDK